jgi:copper chaperone
VQVDLSRQTVVVQSGAGADVLKAAIEEAGYPVKAFA